MLHETNKKQLHRIRDNKKKKKTPTTHGTLQTEIKQK